MFNREKAWHGLGIVVQEDMTPEQAMKVSGLGWTVSKSDTVAAVKVEGEEKQYLSETKDYSAIIRDDTKSILSIQGAGYKPVQNSEVFDLAYSLDKGIKVESAFSMAGGRRLVVLCRTGEMEAMSGDLLHKYMCLVNSHDGTIALSALPTSVRVVCRNTLNMAMAQGAKKSYRVVHSGNMEEKKKAMEKALQLYATTGKLFADKVEALVKKPMTKDELQAFWVDVWGQLETPIVANPTNEDEAENRNSAMEAIGKWSLIFDQERELLHAPANLWLACNAVTKHIQHKTFVGRGRRPTEDSLIQSNLLGLNQDKSIEVMKYALSLAA